MDLNQSERLNGFTENQICHTGTVTLAHRIFLSCLTNLPILLFKIAYSLQSWQSFAKLLKLPWIEIISRELERECYLQIKQIGLAAILLRTAFIAPLLQRWQAV